MGALLYAEPGERVMGEVVTIAENRLPRTHSGEAVAPLGPGGTPLRWELRQDDRRVYADTADDLLTAIIRDYSAGDTDAPATDQLQARIKHAAAVKTQLTAHLLADATSAGGGALNDAEVLRALSASAWHPVTVEEWTHPVPLVLLDVAYQPFTDRPAPCGNIVWLRPSSAEPYLRSLAATGLYAIAEAL